MKVRFLPRDVTVEVAAGTTLFEAGARAAVGIDTACVGKGTCGLCRVKVVEGAAALGPYTEEEERHLGNLYRLTKLRLACRTRVSPDAGAEAVVVVEVVTKRTKA